MENKRIDFYGGAVGPWISMIILVIGMVIAVLFNYTDFYVYNLLMLGAVVICFLLVKQKKQFGDVAIRGLQDSMLSILIIAFMLAGILSKLLRGSGLVEALVWLSGEMNLDAGFIPVIAFLVCVLISTSCGTSSGSIVAVLPVMLPIGIQLGCDASLLTGAVISGALFGDNLAPISDTTIASALTQESKINDVVRTRLPYSLIAGGISAVLFVVFGKLTSQDVATTIDTASAEPKALLLLLVPVVMIIMMRKGWDLGGTLIVCDVLAIAIDLGLGLITPAVMFSGEGPIVNGMNGMIDIIIFCFFLFIVIQTIKESGALELLGESLLKHCKSVRSVELIIMISSALGTIVTAGSSTGILFAGPISNKIAKEYDIAGTRAANILDATACSTCGFVPICTPYLLSLSIGPEIAGIPDDYSYLSIVKWVFHPIFLVLVFLISILTGVGRKYEKRSGEATMKHKYVSERYQKKQQTAMGQSDVVAKSFDDVINLSLGDPDLNTPEGIIRKAFEDAEAGYTKYTDFRGDPELIREICRFYDEEYDMKITPEEVFVTSSATVGMHLALEAILDEGDEVILQAPYFTPYPQQVKLSRGIPVELATYEEEDFQINVQRMESLITQRTKALVINTPNNPTGSCLSLQTMQQIAEVVKRHDLIVIADDIYTDYSYENPFIPFAKLSGMRERTITLNSFSKGFNMTGWRVGHIVAPDYITDAIQEINENVCFTTPSISQRAAIYALQNRKELQPPIIEEYRKRVYYAASRINRIPNMSVLEPPKGTFYLFLNIKETGLSSEAVADLILHQAHVALLPGNAFGACGEGYLRIACTVGVDKLEEAFDRIEKMEIFHK